MALLLKREKYIAFTTRMAGTRKLQLTLRLTVVAVSNFLYLVTCLNDILCSFYLPFVYNVIDFGSPHVIRVYKYTRMTHSMINCLYLMIFISSFFHLEVIYST